MLENNTPIPVSVLIVDDNPAKLTALAAALEGLDIGIVTATSGMEALHMLLAQDFAAVLLDVNMPIMDGFETAEMVRRRPKSEHLPVLFITAERLDDDARLKGYELGAVDYILSPILPQILRSKVAVFADLYRLRERIYRDNEELRIAATAFESQDGIMVTNAHNVILRVNHAFTEITGYTAEEAVGQTPRLLSSDRHDAAFYAAMWKSLLHTGAWQGEICNRRKNGEVFPERLAITAVKGDAGEVTHYVATMHDITERKQAEEQIRALAFYDSLTQLPNRRLLNDRLGKTIASSKRSGRYGAVIFMDLDNFKSLNDIYGHGMGDLLLMKVAHRLTSCVREVDTVARFGGDEFVVILSELDADKTESLAQADIVAEKIRTALAEPYLLKIQPEGKAEATVEHHCTSSIGVMLFINHEASPEDIIKWADIAMYQAKEAGGNLIRFYGGNA